MTRPISGSGIKIRHQRSYAPNPPFLEDTQCWQKSISQRIHPGYTVVSLRLMQGKQKWSNNDIDGIVTTSQELSGLRSGTKPQQLPAMTSGTPTFLSLPSFSDLSPSFKVYHHYLANAHRQRPLLPTHPEMADCPRSPAGSLVSAPSPRTLWRASTCCLHPQYEP
jgi:hypothetical protein